MGLNVFVGTLAASIAEEDEEWFRIRQEQFSKVNKVLREAGLQEHHEPLDLSGARPYDADMYHYHGLHYLRRIAAHEWAGKELPPPGDDTSSRDPIVEQYYSAAADVEKRRMRRGIFGRARPDPSAGIAFEHLMYHSDAEGFYLPIDFEHVIFTARKVGIPGDMLGSTPRLEECMTLAKILGLPLEQDPDSEEVWKLAEAQGRGDAKWKRYGIESFTCLRLFHACKASMAMRAAIVFQ